MYKIVKRYNYTEWQRAVIELDRERKRLLAIQPQNGLQRLGRWISLKGIEWQIKGLMIKGKYKRNEKN